MNPANLPHPQDAGPEYGAVRTILFFALYVALIVGAVLYLRWKLPREEQEKENGEDKAQT
jgi:hypothetical protein